ncbi:MAG: HNH endonuclease [Planctomycetaceae bacterium]
MIDQSLPGGPRRWPIDRVKLNRRDIPLEELLDDLRRVASDLGARSLSKSHYQQRGKFHPATLTARTGTWNAALVAAGLEIFIHRNSSEADLMENFAELWLKLGRQPQKKDLRRRQSRYSPGPYVARFGTYAKALEAFADWAGLKLSVADRSKKSRTAIGARSRRRTPRQPTLRQRVQVLLRDGATCRLCGARPEHGARLEVDHIIPWSKGGETVLENLQILCKRCNRGKCDIADRPSPHDSRA